MNLLNNISDDFLKIGWYTDCTDLLGPGKRFVLWVQGCLKNCEGCIAQSLKNPEEGKLVTVQSLVDEIVASSVEGITISGGEPFLQARSLCNLLMRIRKVASKIGVIVYTGFKYEELNNDIDAVALLEYIDLLIDGNYDINFDHNEPMRGSSNQKLLFLTKKYSMEDMPDIRKNKLVFYDDKFMMIGIPSVETKKVMKIFKEGESENG